MILNGFGENFDKYLWDGPDDSDEEIEEMKEMKTPFEIEAGVKYSKRSMINYIESVIAKETCKNKEDPKNSKLWEEKLKTPNMSYYLKKGGSKLSKT